MYIMHNMEKRYRRKAKNKNQLKIFNNLKPKGRWVITAKMHMRQKFLTVLLVVMVMSGITHAEVITGSCGDDAAYSYNSDTKTFTVSGTGPMKDYSNSQWLGTNIFNRNYNYDDVLEIVVEDGITHIGNYAFLNFRAVTSISIANSVESIGNDAFANCSSLTSVVLPDNITSIDHNAFSGCYSMTDIHLPNNLTVLGNEVFWNCEALNSITIPESLQSCGESLFNNLCINLKTVHWNAIHCEELGGGVLEGSLVTEVVFGPKVQSIPHDFAYQCSNLTKINLPEGLKFIGSWAFSETGITGDLTIPASVEIVEEAAFGSCDIKTLTIKGTISSHRFVFGGNKNLTKVIVSGNIDTRFAYMENTGARTPLFSGCDNLTEVIIEEGVKVIGDGAFWGCPISKIKLPESLEIIGSQAFCETNISEITIPANVTEIRKGAFNDCSFLTTIQYFARNASIGSPYPFSSSQYYLYHLSGAFQNIGSEAHLFIGKNVQRIPKFIFGDAGYQYDSKTNTTNYGHATVKPHFSKIVFEEGSQCSYIGEYAFSGLKYVTEFTCPSADYCYVEKGNGIYNFSPGMDSIIAPAGFFNFEEEYWASAPKNLKKIHVTCGELTDDGFSVISRSKNSLVTLNLSNISNTTLSANAFNGCYNLKKITLPNSLYAIEYMAFADCKSLASIELPEMLEHIGASAFENCRSLSSLVFNNNGMLKTIGNWAFYNCHNLQNITIPKGVTEIGDAAFYGCTYLEDLNLPASLQTIGENTFSFCTKIKKMVVDAFTPPSIYAKTFFEVNRQTPVYVPDESVEAYKNDTYWRELNIQGRSSMPQRIDNLHVDFTKFVKILHDGQILILGDDKTYTITGAEVK